MSRSFQMKAIVAAVSLLIGLSWNVQPAQAQADTITIAAANSLKDAFAKCCRCSKRNTAAPLCA